MIEITKEMKIAKEGELQRYEKITDQRILTAAARGEYKAVFPLDNESELFHALKLLYEKAGYKIVPVGTVGGIRQRDYYIMW